MTQMGSPPESGQRSLGMTPSTLTEEVINVRYKTRLKLHWDYSEKVLTLRRFVQIGPS